jgi:thioredoxin 1
MSSRYIVTLTDANFTQEVLQSATPVVVDFWAEWCGPCKMLTPVLDELADEYDGKVKFGKLNIDENPRTPDDYKVTKIPTLMIFKSGQVVEQVVGMKSKRDLQANLNKYAI